MNVLLLFANGGGHIEQIASTFGVDWTHLISQMISFSIVVHCSFGSPINQF